MKNILFTDNIWQFLLKLLSLPIQLQEVIDRECNLIQLFAVTIFLLTLGGYGSVILAEDVLHFSALSKNTWSSSIGLSEQAGILQGSKFEARFLHKPLVNSVFKSPLDLKLTYEQKELDYNLSEVYTSWEDNNWRISLGRKKIIWSQIDRDWSLGLWEPRYRSNYIKPKAQGLTGLFVERIRPQVRWVAFFSPAFIPDHGPIIREREGNIESRNPWFQSPPKKFQLGTGVSKINYKTIHPDLESLLIKPSHGVLLEFGGKDGWWMRGAYGMKPANQLLLSYRPRLKIREKPLIEVTLLPRFFQEEVVSGDLGYRFSDSTTASISYIQERLVKTEFEEYFVNQVYNNSKGYSVDVSMEKRNWSGSLSYLTISGGESREEGYSFSDEPIFFGRFNYQNAVKIHFKRLLGQSTLKMTWLRDLSQKGTVTVIDFIHRIGTKWDVFAGLELLSAEAKSRTGFISRYTENDRIFGGMTYVF